MSKFVVLGDCHLGARNASNHYSKYFNKFFSDVLYPYMVENDIKKIYQLGDMFDNRTSLSIKAYNACKSTWFDPLVKHGMHMTILLGNHDIYHKSSLRVNTPELLLTKEYNNNITVINKPTIVNEDNTSISLIPWICDENKQQVFDFFKSTKTDLCFGHFEIDGFEMMRGIAGHGGLPRDLFSSFEMTLSGHYHTQSYDDYYRIRYVGTPYEITFADMHDPRGFHVFDTETRKLEFIQNPYTMFDRVMYNEGCDVDVNSLKDKSVKLVVEKKTDLYLFDRFIDSVKLAGVYDLKIIENFNDLKNINVEGEIQLENSLSIINQYIDTLSTSVDKTKLKDYMSSLYTEANE